MRELCFALFLALLLGFPAVARAADAPLLQPGRTERHRLANGLEIVLQQDRRQPRVAVVMAYDVGHRDEPRGYAGIAHLIEHLAYRGSRHVPPFAAMSMLERAGATEINAGVGDDRTYYYAVVPSSSLELVLWIESDRMAFVLEKLNERDVALERAVVLNELRERHGPARLLQDHVARALYPAAHPYAPPISESDDVAATRLVHVQWFFQQTYRPDNACLTVVGDFDFDEVRRLVRNYFAPVGNPPGRWRRPQARDIVFGGKQRMTVAAPYSRERLAMVWPVPGPDHPDAPAVELLAQALGDGPLSRLHARVVDGSGAATTVETDVEHLDLVSWLSVSAELAYNRRHADLERLLDGEIAALHAAPLPAAELEALKRGAITRVVLTHEHLLARALLLAVSARAPNRRLYDPNRDVARIVALTARAVHAAARRHLPLGRRLVAWMQSSSSAPLAGERTGVEGHLYTR